MKRFRKITAITLTFVVIAMLGISASAASFSQTINGDFGVFAVCEGDLSSNAITAWAALFEADYDYIEIVEQTLDVSYVFKSTYNNLQISSSKHAETANDIVDLGFGPPADCVFSSANYEYNAYYIANGVVDCYIHYGPVELTMP